MSKYVVIVDANDTLKEIQRDGRMVEHWDGNHIAPFREIRGEEAERRYWERQAEKSRRFERMLANEPELAEMAARTIARMKANGAWVEA